MSTDHILGIDIGGSGIKGAPVDLSKGALTEERHKIATPEGAKAKDVLACLTELVAEFDGEGKVREDSTIGITMPGVVRRGVMASAANIDKEWIGTDADALFTEHLGREVHVVNDADAAGVAEMRYGAGKGQDGVVLLTTLGTGIGSALFINGQLVPNTELGHLEIDGHDAETQAASSAKEREDLSYKQWAKRLQRYYSHVEMLFSPDLIIVGGGVSRKADKFLPLLELNAPIVPAQLRNEAGIIGAAWYAQNHG